MATRRFKWIAAASAVGLAGLGVVAYNLTAAQAQGLLAQAPLNNQVQTPPAFIMAVDDSGSMTFQTQFPGQDGAGCASGGSFFDRNGNLNVGVGTCSYYYVLPGPVISSGYYAIPQLDSLGFARSPTYNPTYFNPEVKYEPWIDGTGKPYDEANPTSTLIDPRGSTRVALAANYFSGTSRILTGMVIPKGTTYNDGWDRTAEQDITWRGSSNIYVQYWPAAFFLPWTNDKDPYPQREDKAGVYSGVTRVKIDNACGSGCAMWKYTITDSNTDALQNFANWYSFYGNRNRAMIAGMTRSLADVNNLRVGYFRINDYTSYNSVSSDRKWLMMRDLAQPDAKRALYKDMIGLTANGGTPNRWAVDAAALQFTRTDKDAPVKLACQKNAVMLFTDGFSNGGGPTTAQNADGGMGIPFSDSNFNTMADIVSQYYINQGGKPPLRPDLPAGQVPVVQACKAGNPDKRLDCQTNLHLNFYGVTLGARGTLFNPDLDQDPFTDSTIYSRWPASADNDRSTVDDIWHAAVNTRGEYINARTPAEITTAMRRVLSAVTSGASPSGGMGASGARIGAGSVSVAPTYEIANEGTDWFSRLTASKISVDPKTRAVVYTPIWEASAQLPTAEMRNVYFTKSGATSRFNGTNVSLADLCTKSTELYPGMSRCNQAELEKLGATADSAVKYLLGDTAGEKRSGGKLRDRTTRLGDIVTSSPVVSAPSDDYGYRRLAGNLGTTYNAYLASKAERARYMVYVGANDGMLHGFDGGMNAKGVVTGNGGAESFGYIPATALGHMGNLLFPYNAADLNDQKFDHRYYVDGQISVGDTYYGGDWHTTLVGASGAGGRSVFALDVTAGNTFSTASKLWEISDLDNSLPANVRNNIGHVLGKPVIVPVLGANGVPTWKAIFGNGYNSRSQKAVLFVVDIGTGTPNVTMIEAVETSGAPDGNNGLGSIVAIDRWGGDKQDQRRRDGYTDTVYGTDQKGAVWKFDLRSSATTVGTPVFTTRTYTDNNRTLRQPITGGITAGSGPNGGVMLFFGSGSFSFIGDQADTSVQSLYAVNDLANGAVSSTLTSASLTGGQVVTNGDQRTLVRSTPPNGSLGWYVDLPAGERFVGNPSLSDGVVFMPTYLPTPGGSGCSSSGTNWLFGLEALNGGGAFGRARIGSPDGTAISDGVAALKTVTTGTSGGPVRDVKPGALPRDAPPELNPEGGPPKPPEPACVSFLKNGDQSVYIPYPCGRQSWRQIQ
ncbi:pilus assembly protein [Stenotrophomonas maltophilia]|uniref:Pilus assembly protein n=1 Tax=Stenotrophomonas riyadhensis TaxID=2859893 RepID=A0ABT2XJQ4_9GAMM|nr:PilC/PilY family type IV pilus protein [Stenotrophomonas sp. CFS3442]MBH1616715.1 pilus assembly protein [Stenotrophomonas maltophilia]MCV0326045.1 pilus assembly protein [Stenotrophomonas sp. CFS3442]HEL4242822.1 pilus assembly protein [Stenotrophomonas maltophilia]